MNPHRSPRVPAMVASGIFALADCGAPRWRPEPLPDFASSADLRGSQAVLGKDSYLLSASAGSQDAWQPLLSGLGAAAATINASAPFRNLHQASGSLQHGAQRLYQGAAMPVNAYAAVFQSDYVASSDDYQDWANISAPAGRWDFEVVGSLRVQPSHVAALQPTDADAAPTLSTAMLWGGVGVRALHMLLYQLAAKARAGAAADIALEALRAAELELQLPLPSFCMYLLPPGHVFQSRAARGMPNVSHPDWTQLEHVCLTPAAGIVASMVQPHLQAARAKPAVLARSPYAPLLAFSAAAHARFAELADAAMAGAPGDLTSAQRASRLKAYIDAMAPPDVKRHVMVLLELLAHVFYLQLGQGLGKTYGSPSTPSVSCAKLRPAAGGWRCSAPALAGCGCCTASPCSSSS